MNNVYGRMIFNNNFDQAEEEKQTIVGDECMELVDY